jgi:cytochrome c biogenesis protein CcmG/thiol:disulfide interchange protein DsbE
VFGALFYFVWWDAHYSRVQFICKDTGQNPVFWIMRSPPGKQAILPTHSRSLESLAFLSLLMVLLLVFPKQILSDPAPGFSLPLLDGNELISLSELEGKTVYIDFWASWCGPCRQSLPLYEVMNKSLPQDKFQLVAINLDESREDALQFLNKHPVSYTVAFDPEGVSASSWGIRAMPSSFLIGPRGEIIKEWIGFQPAHIEEIEDEIRSLIE